MKQYIILFACSFLASSNVSGFGYDNEKSVGIRESNVTQLADWQGSKWDKTHYYLKKGDVVLFLGNSITQGAAPLIAYLTADIKEKYPELLEGEDRVQFIIAGIGGEQAFEGLKRLPELLEQHKPTVCVVNYGTCEVTFENQQAYLPAMEKILSTLKAAGTATTIVSPPPCSPANWKSVRWPATQFIAGLPIMAQQARKLAKREGLLFADAFKALSKHNKGDGAELTTDGIHLTQQGTDGWQMPCKKPGVIENRKKLYFSLHEKNNATTHTLYPLHVACTGPSGECAG